MARRLRTRSLPLVLLAVLSLTSLVVRAAWLGQPCRAPCRSAADHLLIFDESYYVNAARIIAGVRAPPGGAYATAPLGDDPNAEHPQLAKLAIAGGIELFGDGPLAWRLPSLLLGSLAIVGVFALVRAAGGERWTALGAAALMAADNLLLVHSRIATLDIYVLAAMIWAAVLYLRGRPVAAGLLLGVGACFKLVAPYLLVALAIWELLRRRAVSGAAGRSWRAAAGALAACAAAGAVAFIGLLTLLDRVAPPYDLTAGRAVKPGPLHHLAHMVSYAAKQTSPHGPKGIASYPWQWLVDLKPIVYLNINPGRPSAGLAQAHPQAHFLGMISPPLLALGVPVVIGMASGLARRSRYTIEPGPVGTLGLAWFLGTFVPFLLLSLIWSRTSYLYYMVIVMPGIYLIVAELIQRVGKRHRRLVLVWWVTVIAAAVIMYPFTPLP
jgi:dolichyl-phosphate-mannose-protein mannosyltransferase